ncbi:MAG TPA: aminodeoxychorismate lyase [Acidimicrobiales bacterium]
MTTVWIDGTLCDAADARVSPFDHGLLTGDGVFETLKVYGGVPFAMRRHLERLEHSCKGLGLPCPDHGLLRDAMAAVIEANGLDSGRIRITLTGGVSPLGSDRGADGPLVIVAGGPLHEWPPSTDVVTVPWPRNERGALSGLKTTSYGENVVALAYAKERGAGEAIFGNTVGNLCEGTGTNVFLSLDGELVTPPLSSGCLAGVTRALVLELTDCVERDVPLAALADADEAFLSSTTREVQPIRAIDGRERPAVPGPLTTAAAEAFGALVARDLDP